MPPGSASPSIMGPDHVLEPDGVRHQRRDDHHDEGPHRQQRARGGALVGDVPPRGPRHQPHEHKFFFELKKISTQNKKGYPFNCMNKRVHGKNRSKSIFYSHENHILYPLDISFLYINF
jgi:hypothetical protein